MTGPLRRTRKQPVPGATGSHSGAPELPELPRWLLDSMRAQADSEEAFRAELQQLKEARERNVEAWCRMVAEAPPPLPADAEPPLDPRHDPAAAVALIEEMFRKRGEPKQLSEILEDRELKRMHLIVVLWWLQGWAPHPEDPGNRDKRLFPPEDWGWPVWRGDPAPLEDRLLLQRDLAPETVRERGTGRPPHPLDEDTRDAIRWLNDRREDLGGGLTRAAEAIEARLLAEAGGASDQAADDWRRVQKARSKAASIATQYDVEAELKWRGLAGAYRDVYKNRLAKRGKPKAGPKLKYPETEAKIREAAKYAAGRDWSWREGLEYVRSILMGHRGSAAGSGVVLTDLERYERELGEDKNRHMSRILQALGFKKGPTGLIEFSAG